MAGTEPTHRPILRALSEAHGEPITGEALGRKLGISRTAVWKQVQKLRSMGYPIESLGKKGYRLAGPVDLLSRQELAPRLTTRWLGHHLEHHQSVGSTNERAMELARAGAPNGTVVGAEAQTQGRGRLQRSWSSPMGKGIYVSLVLRPELPPRRGPEMTLLAALALAESIRDAWNLDARIKWPNDLLLSDRKAAGILTEMQSESERIQFLVVGTGINVFQTREDLGGDLLYPATSLALELDAAMSGAYARPPHLTRAKVLAGYLNRLETLYEGWVQEGLAPYLKRLKERSAVLGRYVRVQTGETTVVGRVTDIAPDGALVLEENRGGQRALYVGDILRVRPAEQAAGPEGP
ncbi:BirA family transcriptional regulator, biotin operon repressor / biotin-[acetyl-CoA-carboxylase] ligase [Desulfacinum hydrothermale DSM 13146]|uniref:Bifunctional ligase/repressor BirA n=1 Tax=Desulfacinum hydrothermale DSM 13146 TaxID=1121390 RepID=A0A1W1XIC4_9BACT|nr:biotin--[acetyl-CoA-carboxylase] ligase [Desulfacinum hydrothermale]SMC23587.1 BirA family transcriptional regulator, biotin operon repressor / biotin-[acetyl-CoA-carboxylase] ligase [Desulfacinum hydrothermale DSM 13146]